MRPEVGSENARNRSQGGRLAGAVGSDQADDLAGRQLEGQVVDGRERPARGPGVGACELLDGQGHEDSYVKIGGSGGTHLLWLVMNPRSKRIVRA